MAKQDWGAIQKLFLAEYAKTKISPKEWCEANGHNYATARQHIKIPAQGKEKKRSAQDAQIPAPIMPGVSAAGGDDYCRQAGVLLSQHAVKADELVWQQEKMVVQ